MDKFNCLYPYGEGFDSFLEYRLSCPQCGKTIRLFLPEELTRTGYSTGGSLCHNFPYSINRGVKTLFAGKVIKLRNDSFGSSCLLTDNYRLYPLLPGETEEERKARLIKTGQAETEALLPGSPEKKQWVIETLVTRNDTVLNALEEILKAYEKTAPEGRDALDRALLAVTPQDDAEHLLRRFNIQSRQSVRQPRQEAVNTFAAQDFMNGFGSFFPAEEPKAEPPKPAPRPAGDEWICSCGTRAAKKFCPNCGAPSPGLR